MDTAKLEGHRNSRQVSGTQGSENKGSSSSRKRVFTFQKRWLHSLPIMEKTLHEDDLKRSSGSAEDEPLEEVRHGENGSESRDVVVCMLCDEIAVNRDLMKVWSRMNCRRGRIENHLMSKHPEFMLLLKHKRETEGELAVQIFLQNMRDGKLSARNEISTNLYSQINTTMGLDLTDANKRTFGVTSALNALDPTLRASMVSGGSVLKDSDFENKRKKLKTVTKTSETLQKSGEDNEAVDIVQNDGSALTAPWVVNGEVNKVIMIIGGDLPFVAETATNLWLLGADVLLTFSNVNKMQQFRASHFGRFPEDDATSTGRRGAMLPMVASLHSKREIETWAKALGERFPRIDSLVINATTLDEIAEQTPFSVHDILDVCESLHTAYFQNVSDSSIVLITKEQSSTKTTKDIRANMVGASVKNLVSSLSEKWHQMGGVRINCIALKQTDIRGTGSLIASVVQTLAFLLSSSSALLTGSTLELHAPSQSTSSASSLVL